ncbi:hypothetical protein R50073_19700 [Maricurvus nonylphenolicus]|uniref:AraC family transcriptional regulator n=1 Tax=Maricurvus nonylphenolicus TaxID=1008307 RepID=UPI0036F323D9
MDLIGFLYGFGLLHGILLAVVLLLSQSGHRLANGFMAGLVLAMGLHLLHYWLIRTGYFIDHPSLARLIPPLHLTWGPLLYLYAYSLTNRSVSWLQALHFLPAVFFFTSSIQFMFIPEEHQRELLSYLWTERTAPLSSEVASFVPGFWRIWIDLDIPGNLFAIQFVIYNILVLRQIRLHNIRMKQHFSSLEKMNLRWLSKLTLLCLGFLVIYVLFNRTQMGGVHFDANALIPSIPWIFLVFVVYAIGLSALFQPSLIHGVTAASHSSRDNIPQVTEEKPSATENQTQTTDTQQEQLEVAPESKYKRSRISLKDAEAFKMRIMQHMQDEELYLDSELTLPILAEKTGLSTHQVSQVINSQMGQNFFSFVNNYRIQRAKELLTDTEAPSMPVIDLAMEVGFKSKSSFYEAFKKTTGMTPLQYKKSLDQSSEGSS